jgi:hypothetical protein
MSQKANSFALVSPFVLEALCQEATECGYRQRHLQRALANRTVFKALKHSLKINRHVAE